MIEVNGMRPTCSALSRDGGKTLLSVALLSADHLHFRRKAHTLQRGMDVIVNPGSADTVAEQLLCTRSATRPC